ncbi:FecR domain-containing protein [Achromobacter kerstersii]|uniref:FecR domain-containing protein n=1 Tax=Achromobacter kerstersii TaxID=1353890 RepID=UPI0006C63D9A|nr:FecR domain-containing protein [Achromobacter kerstersii]CUI60176.1 fec operon regulator FecR [Achromobacter kerstersii]
MSSSSTSALPRSQPAVVTAAVDWLICLQCDPTPAELARWQAWREACPDHDVAWQRVTSMSQVLDAHAAKLPGAVASQVVEQISRSHSGRRRVLLALLGVSVTGALVAVSGEPAPWRVWTAAYRSGVGERRLLTLEDGTRLMLNTRSAVDTRFDAQARRIVLVEGEIQIESGQDAAGRPLIVETRSGFVSPIGTRFIVRQLGDEAQTHVSVQEGAVRIQTRLGGTELRLNRGERTSFDRYSVDAAQPSPDNADAWTSGMVFADNWRLGDFLSELRRYRRGFLRCDPAVAELRVTGAFPVQDTDKVLRLIEKILPVRVHTRSAYWVTVGP